MQIFAASQGETPARIMLMFALRLAVIDLKMREPAGDWCLMTREYVPSTQMYVYSQHTALGRFNAHRNRVKDVRFGVRVRIYNLVVFACVKQHGTEQQQHTRKKKHHYTRIHANHNAKIMQIMGGQSGQMSVE